MTAGQETQDCNSGAAPYPAVAQLVLPCSDLDAAIAFYTGALGFRLDMIMPADAPRIALVSGHGIALRLERGDDRPAVNAPITLRLVGDAAQCAAFATDTLIAPDGVRIELIDRNGPIETHSKTPTSRTQEFLITHTDAPGAWVNGRAGMQYRDLIPGRLGGRFIASHIRIPDGGPASDYVHYHKVGFQMIYCKHGWVRVVYEDQGPPFVMHAGDCVLQPPTIRHRVLEASPGLEVIEVSFPAEHETLRDHALELPTGKIFPNRLFGGQRFVRHIAANAAWQAAQESRLEFRDTGISDATDGIASVRVLRLPPPLLGERVGVLATHAVPPQIHHGDFLFLLVLDGRLDLISRSLGTHTLDTGDACVIPTGADYALESRSPAEVLEVAMPQRDRERA